jgi:hypothetical protein
MSGDGIGVLRGEREGDSNRLPLHIGRFLF